MQKNLKSREAQLKWVKARSVGAAQRLAPHRPGVYAIGQVDRTDGLVLEVHWRYVGRATVDLSRRLGDHRTVAEKNLRLRNWLATHPVDLEVWFASTTSAETAIRVERRLIQEIDPEFNTLLRPTRAGRVG